MSDLWKVVAEIAVELHSNTVEDLADEIARVESFQEFNALAKRLDDQSYRNSVARLQEAWGNREDISPSSIAAGLRAASQTAELKEKQESLDLVWTGPGTGLVPCRYTEQVLVEVISAASDRIFLVSFVAYDVAAVRNSLNAAAGRKVRIDILLESAKEHGGKLNVDSIRAYKDVIPSAHMFTWHPKADPESKWNGVVHAKCAVADGKMAFVTSANLSHAAMERNMELGILVRGGSLPDKLDRHLAALITTGIVERV